MSTYKIAVFVGSLRAASINLRLARALEKLVPPDFKFDYVNLDVPLFNQDNENNLPRAWPSSSSRSPNPRACCSSRPSTIARCPPPSRTPSTGARVRGVTTPGPARPPGCSAPRPAPPAPRSCSSTCATSWPPKAQHIDARGLPAVLGRPGERTSTRSPTKARASSCRAGSTATSTGSASSTPDRRHDRTRLVPASGVLPIRACARRRTRGCGLIPANCGEARTALGQHGKTLLRQARAGRSKTAQSLQNTLRSPVIHCFAGMRTARRGIHPHTA